MPERKPVMDNKIEIFKNEQFGEVRTILEGEKVLFCAADVAKALGYTNPNKAVNDHCRAITKRSTPISGKVQSINFIPEGDVYRLIIRSNLPAAEKFELWVFDEVIPTIRKTGGYIATKQDDTPEEIMARALTIAQATLAKREERLKQLEAQTEQQQTTIELQDKEIKEAAPKVNYYNNHLQSVNTLTSTQIAKQIGMDAEKLHKKLKEANVIYRQSGQWLLHSPYSTWGLHSTRTQTYTRSDGSIGTNVYTVWTERGRRFIIALYENEWNVRRAIKQIKGEIDPAA